MRNVLKYHVINFVSDLPTTPSFFYLQITLKSMKFHKVASKPGHFVFGPYVFSLFQVKKLLFPSLLFNHISSNRHCFSKGRTTSTNLIENIIYLFILE